MHLIVGPRGVVQDLHRYIGENGTVTDLNELTRGKKSFTHLFSIRRSGSGCQECARFSDNLCEAFCINYTRWKAPNVEERTWYARH